MRYFILESEFLKPFKEFGSVVSRHREYLQNLYDRDVLLCSGLNPLKSGGFIIGKASSMEDIQAIIDADPYHTEKLATYKIKQFDPGMKAEVLCNW